MSGKKGEENSRFVAVVMIVVIMISVATLVYVNIPHEEKVPQNIPESGGGENEVVLTLIYGNESFNYTLEDLMGMESFTGSGGFIKRSGTVVGPNNYTGVRISTLLNGVSHLPQSFTLEATASDGYTVNYTYDEIKGHVMVYNESGGETGIGNLTMIVAYKENGVLLNESTGGPLRVAFVDDGAISSSSLWIRSVVALSIRG